MHSVISILPIRAYVVHNDLFLLWTEVVLASFNSATPIRTGVGEVVLAMLVS
jgi:hypothetical protein